MALPSCVSYFSVTAIKHHDQEQHLQEFILVEAGKQVVRAGS